MVTIPTFKLPPLISQIGTRLPQWPHSLGLASMLNLAKLMRLLPEDSLDAMEGRLFRVSVSDTGGTGQFSYSGGRFRPVFSAHAVPDLAFTADLAAYLQLVSRQEDPDTLFFNRRLLIEGDTELGLVVKNMLDAVDWSRLPIPARFRHVA
jgi:predicted lipid carrier protein YhbT